ncbi:MAG TPA: hypothetical protein VLW17_05875 [Thermoanaerobaculaceae bacterium]|nr:hypothetical protein [Thermoanaerobaculaceae bacterium]
MPRPHRTTVWTLAGALLAGSAFAATPAAPALDAEQWREDLRYFAEQLPRIHMNAFHAVTRERFEAAVGELDRQIPSLRREQIVVGFAKLVAMLADGHTHINPATMGLRAYPIRLYSFTDGIYVISAAKEHAAIVGGRVLRIGRTRIERAYQAIRTIIPRERDNEMWCRNLGPRLLEVPELLDGLDLIDDMESATIVVEKEGREVSAVVHPGPVDPEGTRHGWPPLPASWVDARESAVPPLWLKDPSNPYWFEFLPDSRVLYVQYNAVQNRPDEPVAAFFERVSRFVDANPVDKLVIDVRLNGGGNNYLNLPLLHWILRCDKVNQPGKLFTIIGRQTFSAAQNFVNMMAKYTGTIFVGEPTGEAPNMFGDPAGIVLPNSRLEIRASTLWWQDMDQRDMRRWQAPQVAAEASFADYRRGVDPAIEAVLHYAPQPGVAAAVRESLAKGDFDAARAAIRSFRADSRNAYASVERDLNDLGYELMGHKQLDRAIAVFKLAVEAYPDSANAYDSLGEAYANAGQRDLAIANYSKSLQLDPANGNAARMLERLRSH